MQIRNSILSLTLADSRRIRDDQKAGSRAEGVAILPDSAVLDPDSPRR